MGAAAPLELIFRKSEFTNTKKFSFTLPKDIEFYKNNICASVTNSMSAMSLLIRKKSRTWETKQLSTDADSSTNTKKILVVRQNLLQKQTFFCAAILHPL